MFKWPGIPATRAPEHELADFAELLCWNQGITSATEMCQALGRLAENEYSDGVPEEDDEYGQIEAAFQEIELRSEACDGGYPFAVNAKGNSLHFIGDLESERYVVYRFLLLATRLNMSAGQNTNRINAQIDGTQLFEELSAATCLEYFGDRAESMVFGTAASGTGFQKKVEHFCDRINEGGGYINRTAIRRSDKDGKLDVVAWKSFSDRLVGKLVAFGQCKTGTNFRDSLTQLQPDSFCQKWLQSPLAITPLRMFFVAEALRRGEWYNMASDAGLMFDRCRIVDFSRRLSKDLLGRLEAWTQAASQANQIAP